MLEEKAILHHLAEIVGKLSIDVAESICLPILYVDCLEEGGKEIEVSILDGQVIIEGGKRSYVYPLADPNCFEKVRDKLRNIVRLNVK